MKLRPLINFLIILVLFLVNDAMYQSRRHLEAYLYEYKAVEYEQIEGNEAVLIIDGNPTESIINSLANQYYIDSVMVIQKDKLIEMLAHQYRLTDSQNLLEDISLPQVLKCSFKGDSFQEMESGLFLEMIQNDNSISRLLYSEDNYTKSWQIIGIIENLEAKIDLYWSYIYSGFAFLILFVIFDISVIREKHKKHYWKIFLLSGGAPNCRLRKRLLSGFFMVFFPSLFALGGEYYLFSINENIISPDFEFHLFRFALGLLMSFAAILIIRNDKNA